MEETRLLERKQLREIKIKRSKGFFKSIFTVVFNIMINYVALFHEAIEILGKQIPIHLFAVGIFFNYIFFVQLTH